MMVSLIECCGIFIYSELKKLLITIGIFNCAYTGILQVTGQEQPFQFETPDRKEAIYLSSFGISYDGSFRFKVKACRDADVILKAVNPENEFRIILGGWANTKSAIRKTYNNDLDAHYSLILSCDVYKTFWISWDTSEIKVGQGEIGSNVFLSWNSTEELIIADIGVYTWREQKGNWEFNITTGGWGSWYSDEDCSVTCGRGVRRYKRDCSDPIPGSFVTNCVGNTDELRECQNEGCIGGWGSWETIGGCSTKCGNGQQLYGRICNQPVPSDNLSYCRGEPFDNRHCFLESCPVSRWSYFKDLNITREEMKIAMEEELTEMKEKLTVNPKNTTSSIRRRICAPDERPSAASVGYAGAILLAIPFVFLVGCDCLRLFQKSQ